MCIHTSFFGGGGGRKVGGPYVWLMVKVYSTSVQYESGLLDYATIIGDPDYMASTARVIMIVGACKVWMRSAFFCSIITTQQGLEINKYNMLAWGRNSTYLSGIYIYIYI